MSLRAAVLGNGTMGTALADVITAAGHGCTLWCPDPDVAAGIGATGRHPRHFSDRPLARGLRATADVADALADAECVIVAVPSSVFRETVAGLRGRVGAETPLLSATKGVELETGKRMSELIAEAAGSEAVGAIAGPNLAYDLVTGRPTALVVASPFAHVRRTAAELLQGGSRRVIGTADLCGVEWIGVLKNVIALAVGIAGGLGLGDNARSTIFARGLAEIARVALKLGAQPQTLSGIATVGDLFLTTTAAASRNHLAGVQLGRGIPLPQVVRELAEMQETAEGLQSARLAHSLAVGRQAPAPIIEAVYRIVAEAQPPVEVFARLLDDPALYED